MIYYLYHWYNGDIEKVVPEAFRHTFTTGTGTTTTAWAVEIDNIHDFVEKYGNIVLNRPTTMWPYWSIYITDKSGQFRQK